MSYCCKRTDCTFQCCNSNGDCTQSYVDCVYHYNGPTNGCKDWAGTIVGIVIGSVICLVLIIIGLVYLYHCLKKRYYEPRNAQEQTITELQNVIITAKSQQIQQKIKQVSNKNGKEQGTCCICILELQTNKTIKLQCKHVLHQKCLKQWRSKSNHCPLCRQQIIGFL